ncbi:MAG: CinA family protein [Hyphomicrobium sp.]
MSALFPVDLVHDAEALLAELKRLGFRLATVESCTGGLLAGLLTEIAGSSAVFERGFVTYSNSAKSELIGVPPALLERHGAVSEEVARAMAEGALAHAPVDVAVSVTGIAGPDGGSPDKPVGLVYIAAAPRGRPTLVRECRFGSIGRTAIRLATVRTAMELARQAVSATARH